MIRLFVALKIPLEIRQQIIELEKIICPEFLNYKWEPIEKIHLTLKFIGSIDEKIVPEVINALNFIGEYESYNCTLTKLGLFYRFRNPNILWIGLNSSPSIKLLAKHIDKEMSVFSIPEEQRYFKSHITLLRIKNSIDDIFKKNIETLILPNINFLINECILFESKLKPTGSIYNELHVYKLK